MHEYSLVLSLLEHVAAQAAAHPGASVRRVEVRIGEQAGVVVEQFATAFELARRDTVAAEAELVLERVPARWACPGCAREIPSGDRLACPDCGDPAHLVAGDELYLMRLELEVT
ncbi:MAG: hydrogenase maturation nickel metallochaperone HypA [Polyangiaceae bacterium]|nr:hydrogenase maturation nickel metallochaperone HypA [Polyangiaceae bacterium]